MRFCFVAVAIALVLLLGGTGVSADNNECPLWRQTIQCAGHLEECTAQSVLARNPDFRTDSVLCTDDRWCSEPDNFTCIDNQPSSQEYDPCDTVADCLLSPEATRDMRQFECYYDKAENSSYCLYTTTRETIPGCRSVGDSCFVDEDCYNASLTCEAGICTGLPSGAECIFTWECDEGMYCDYSEFNSFVPQSSLDIAPLPACRTKKSAGTNATSASECASDFLENGKCYDVQIFSKRKAEVCSRSLYNSGITVECDAGLYCNTSSLCDDVQMQTCTKGTQDHFKTCYGTNGAGGMYGECMCDHVGGTHECYEVAQEYCSAETRAWWDAQLDTCQDSIPLGDICTTSTVNYAGAGSCMTMRTACIWAQYHTCIENTIDAIFLDKIEDTELCSSGFETLSSDFLCNINEQELVVQGEITTAAVMVPVSVVVVLGAVFFFRGSLHKTVSGPAMTNLKLFGGAWFMTALITALMMTSLATMAWGVGKEDDGQIEYGLFEVCAFDECSDTVDSLSLNDSSRDLLSFVQGITVVVTIYFAIQTFILLFYVINWTQCISDIAGDFPEILLKIHYGGSLIGCILLFCSFTLFAAFYNAEDGLAHEFEPPYDSLDLGYSWGLVLLSWFVSLPLDAFMYRATLLTHEQITAGNEKEFSSV